MLTELVRAAVATLRDPRAGARRVMAVRMERRQRWEVLLLIAVLSAALAYLSFLLNARLGHLGQGARMMSPFAMLAAQVVVLWVMVFAVHHLGRLMGGKGSLDDAILLVAWIQAILIGMQILQIGALVLLPALSVLLGLAGFILLFWLLTVFVAELHGFRSLVAVFLSVLLVMIVLATLMRVLFGMLGVDFLGVV